MFLLAVSPILTYIIASIHYIYKYRNENNKKTLEKHRKCRVKNPEWFYNRHKKWREENPDKVKEQITKSHSTETYKQTIVKRCSTHIDCPCGGKYTGQNKTNHYKSDLHNKYLASL